MADLAARTAPSRVGPERPDPSAEAAPIPLLPEDRPAPAGGPATRARVLEIRPGTIRERDDLLVAEEPLAIRACGPGQAPVEVAVTMRTPGDEVDLALGFLFTEGLLDPSEVAAVELGDPGRLARPDDEVTVRLRRPVDLGRIAERRFVATAACGICGKASIDEVVLRVAPPPAGRPIVAAAVVAGLPDRLRLAQPTFRLTGGLHAAALFRPDGELVAVREDVGRHNALDKLVGSQLRLGRLPLHDAVLLVSGRVSFEIVQKAAAAGIPIVAAVSAPSDLAVEAAARLGMTLVGFVRGGRCNVYTGAERIRPGAAGLAVAARPAPPAEPTPRRRR
jgi:FdhD protein